ncbi:hypothetical protein [Xenorhabdus koppenhoeferi]|uniref:Phosphotransferase system, enzyme I, PtsP n=1 Tax=Xenorhabdus koppenhoeferi TaxID=351659 RepID=A0A1I7FGX7_9GAMM|nr:hypothetical protein [Xenorhabdus koppenhoeferi]SFU35473.1 phosphotransferase system, enzyme I, PtsP [Xenorhabdus koppenhoeferi]
MLMRLREIVEKVAMAANLSEALELLVNETCLAMQLAVILALSQLMPDGF